MAFAILGDTSSSTVRALTVAAAIATQSAMGTAISFADPYIECQDEGNLKGKVGFGFGGLGMIGKIWSFFFVSELKRQMARDLARRPFSTKKHEFHHQQLLRMVYRQYLPSNCTRQA